MLRSDSKCDLSNLLYVQTMLCPSSHFNQVTHRGIRYDNLVSQASQDYDNSTIAPAVQGRRGDQAIEIARQPCYGWKNATIVEERAQCGVGALRPEA